MRKSCYLIVCAIMLLSSCNENEMFDEPKTYDVKGKVEKGPFISGSTITIQPMNGKLQVLGSMNSTVITDDLGNFMFGSMSFAAPYAELMATGYFFNEVKGALSNGTLTLRALADVQDNTTVNVNILTHLKYARVKNLVANGKKFKEANEQAQKELFEAFGLSRFGSNDVSSFSIVAGTDEAAALIAISSLLLADRSEAALTEYLSKLSEDFGKNGCFSDNLKAQIDADKNKLYKELPDIKEHIKERYSELGINVNVKELYPFVDWDSDGVAGNEMLAAGDSIILDKQQIEVPNEGGTYTVKITSPIPLFLKPQTDHDYITSNPNDRIEFDDMFSTGMYEGYNDSMLENDVEYEGSLTGKTLTINVSELQSIKDKSINIPLYDYIGNVVATVKLLQKGEPLSNSIPSTPLLGETAKQIIADIAAKMAEGLREYTLFEQYYNYNKVTNCVKNYIYPSNSKLGDIWSNLYSANHKIQLLRNADEARLDIYGNCFNILSAIYYSTLVYGWGGVPYINNTEALNNAINDAPRTPQESIFADIKKNLNQTIGNLPEKKNESLKDINGFFFASKDVARVLLANIHMYEGDYSSAKPLLEKVIENGFYKLDASTDFKPSTTSDAIEVTESTEVIFALLYDSGTRANITFVQPGVMPYITLSDVYLSLAECNCKTGNSSKAEDYIAAVADAKKITVTETDVMLRIKELREQILLYSGTYFAFLKRTGLAREVCGIEEYQLLLPISEDELRFNHNLIQNPGY